LKSIKLLIQTNLAKILISLIASLSLKTCHRLGAMIGVLTYLIPNRNRLVTEKNIQHCFPNLNAQEQHKLIKNSLQETGKTLTEAAPMWQWNKDKLFSLIKNVKGEEQLQNAIANNKGIILALPHLGNWELLGLYCSANYPTTSMYQKPKVTQIEDIVKKGREHLGAKLVPADNTGVRAMLKALNNNELVCILPDQEPNTGTGLFAPFFKQEAYSMTLISRLAKKTKAEVILAYAIRLDSSKGYEIIFKSLPKMVDALADDSLYQSVEYLNAEIENSVRENPQQYQWSYKRFRTRPENKAQDTRIDFYNN